MTVSDYGKFQQRIFDEMNELNELNNQRIILDFLERGRLCGIDVIAELEKGRPLLEIAHEVNQKLPPK